MTRDEFNKLNALGKVPKEGLGQGFEYKDDDFDWDNGDPTDIIYIPD